MTANRGVVYTGPGTVEVQSIAYPELKTPRSRNISVRSRKLNVYRTRQSTTKQAA